MSWVTNLVKTPRQAIANRPATKFHVWLVQKIMFQKMHQLALPYLTGFSDICQDKPMFCGEQM